MLSSQFYDSPGNFPAEIVFSCQMHRDDDQVAPDLFRCNRYLVMRRVKKCAKSGCMYVMYWEVYIIYVSLHCNNHI